MFIKQHLSTALLTSLRLDESIIELADGLVDCHVISQTWCLESVPRRKRSREGQETSSRQRVCGLCLSVDLKLLHQHASTGTELSQPGDKIKDKALKGK